MLGVRARPAAWLAGGLGLLSVGLAVAAVDFPPVAGLSGYAAIVDGDGLRVV
jgi:hypothetical protein